MTVQEQCRRILHVMPRMMMMMMMYDRPCWDQQSYGAVLNGLSIPALCLHVHILINLTGNQSRIVVIQSKPQVSQQPGANIDNCIYTYCPLF